MHKDNDVVIDALSELAGTFAPLKAKAFYEAISRYFVQHLDIEYAFVGKLSSGKNGVSVQAGWHAKGPMETFYYDLEPTPCKNVIANDHAMYASGVSELFPDDKLLHKMGIEAYAGSALFDKELEPMGIVVALSTTPFENPHLIATMLDLFVTSISAEMLRGEDEKQRDDLQEIAYYDPLTKLPNRLLLRQEIAKAKNRLHQTGKKMAVCMLDLDGFKEVNDTFGHEAGDAVLVEASNRISRGLRSDDVVSRIGGDEFVIVLTALYGADEAAKTLMRLLQDISAAYSFETQKITSISASIGVSIYPDDNVDDDLLLRHADQAMYRAKEGGKNRFEFFDVNARQKVKANFQALKKIHKALDKGQFELYFQPQLSTFDLNITKVEALCRWNHPILGTLGPSEFLPLIEDDELVFMLDQWVITNALQQMRYLKDSGFNLKISVNISPKHFGQKSFLTNIRQYMEQKGLDVDMLRFLEFEIVETAALESVNHTNEVISECNDLGISVALDDFGTGYSSLTHLKQLRVDTLKIDQSFVQDMLTDSQDMAIVDAVISLSKVFQIEVIAEGVESIEQLLMLSELGCDTIQGFHVARPMPAAALVQFLRQFAPDPRWQITSPHMPSRADFELLLAQTIHKHWIDLVVEALKNKDFANLPKLSSQSCRLGKWMRTSAKKYFTSLQSFGKLTTVHQKVHRKISMIVQDAQKSDAALTAEQEQSIHRLKKELLQCIEDLRGEYVLEKATKGVKRVRSR
ncbi:MAG: EAL domain-containing protein [Campylobacterota bacterium]